MDGKKKKINQAVKKIIKSPEYFVFANFMATVSKICRPSLRRRIIARYKNEIKAAFLNLKARIRQEMPVFSSPGEKMEFARILHSKAPAYSWFYDLNI